MQRSEPLEHIPVDSQPSNSTIANELACYFSNIKTTDQTINFAVNFIVAYFSTSFKQAEFILGKSNKALIHSLTGKQQKPGNASFIFKDPKFHTNTAFSNLIFDEFILKLSIDERNAISEKLNELSPTIKEKFNRPYNADDPVIDESDLDECELEYLNSLQDDMEEKEDFIIKFLIMYYSPSFKEAHNKLNITKYELLTSLIRQSSLPKGKPSVFKDKKNGYQNTAFTKMIFTQFILKLSNEEHRSISAKISEIEPSISDKFDNEWSQRNNTSNAQNSTNTTHSPLINNDGILQKKAQLINKHILQQLGLMTEAEKKSFPKLYAIIEKTDQKELDKVSREFLKQKTGWIQASFSKFCLYLNCTCLYQHEELRDAISQFINNEGGLLATYNKTCTELNDYLAFQAPRSSSTGTKRKMPDVQITDGPPPKIPARNDANVSEPTSRQSNLEFSRLEDYQLFTSSSHASLYNLIMQKKSHNDNTTSNNNSNNNSQSTTTSYNDEIRPRISTRDRNTKKRMSNNNELLTEINNDIPKYLFLRNGTPVAGEIRHFSERGEMYVLINNQLKKCFTYDEIPAASKFYFELDQPIPPELVKSVKWEFKNGGTRYFIEIDKDRTKIYDYEQVRKLKLKNQLYKKDGDGSFIPLTTEELSSIPPENRKNNVKNRNSEIEIYTYGQVRYYERNVKLYKRKNVGLNLSNNNELTSLPNETDNREDDFVLLSKKEMSTLQTKDDGNRYIITNEGEQRVYTYDQKYLLQCKMKYDSRDVNGNIYVKRVKKIFSQLINSKIILKINLDEDEQTLRFFYSEKCTVTLWQLYKSLFRCYQDNENQIPNFALIQWADTPTLSKNPSSPTGYELTIKLKHKRKDDNNLLDLFIYILKLKPCAYVENYDFFLKKLNYYRVNETAAIIAFDSICSSSPETLDPEEVKPLLAAMALGIIKRYSVNNPDNKSKTIDVEQYGPIVYVNKYIDLPVYYSSSEHNLPDNTNGLAEMPEYYAELLPKDKIVSSNNNPVTPITPFATSEPATTSSLGIFSAAAKPLSPAPVPVNNAESNFDTWLNQLALHEDKDHFEPNEDEGLTWLGQDFDSGLFDGCDEVSVLPPPPSADVNPNPISGEDEFDDWWMRPGF